MGEGKGVIGRGAEDEDREVDGGGGEAKGGRGDVKEEGEEGRGR